MTEEQLSEHARLYPYLQPPPRFPSTTPLKRLGEWFVGVDDWLDLQHEHWAPLFQQHFPEKPIPRIQSVGARGRQAELTWSLRIDRLELLDPIETRLREQWWVVNRTLHAADQEDSSATLMVRLVMLQQFLFLFESYISSDDRSLVTLMAAMSPLLDIP